MKYDTLLNYIDKYGAVDLPTALTLLDGYSHPNTRYQTLDRLCQRKLLERDITVRPNVFRRHINPRFVGAKGKTAPSFDNNLNDIAGLYRYFVRYGAQHFSAPGRVKFMSIMKVWLDQRRDLLQFVERLQELIDNPPSHAAYLSVEKGLKEAGWYSQDYDSVDLIDTAISMLNPNRVEHFMGITEETWRSLKDYDGLDRVKEAEEGSPACIEPEPDTVNRLHWKQQLYKHYGGEENWPKNQSEVYTRFQQQRDAEHR